VADGDSPTGIWGGTPVRMPNFTTREAELAQLRRQLTDVEQQRSELCSAAILCLPLTTDPPNWPTVAELGLNDWRQFVLREPDQPWNSGHTTAATTADAEDWPFPALADTAPSLASGMEVTDPAATRLSDITPAWIEANLPSLALPPANLSVPGAMVSLPTDIVDIWQWINRYQPWQFGAVLFSVLAVTGDSAEDGLTYASSNDRGDGVLLVLEAGAASSYRDGLLRLVDSIWAILCRLLVILLAALSRHPIVRSLTLILLASVRCFGRRGECDDHVLSALRPGSVVGEALGIA
jgi:hypothetical protein